MGILTDIFTTLGDSATGIGSFIGNIFTSVVALFYASPDGTAPAELTVVGVLLLIASAMGLFLWAFKWIRSLIKVRG